MLSSLSDRRTVVLELGEAVVRAGIGGHCQPIVQINLSEVGKIRDSWENKVTGSSVRSSLFDPNICPGPLAKEKVCALFSNILIETMLLKPKDFRVLVIEHIFLNKYMRNIVASTLLSVFQFASISFQPGLVLPPLLFGSADSIVVDIGHRESRTIALVDFRPILRSLRTVSAGLDTARRAFGSLMSRSTTENRNININSNSNSNSIGDNINSNTSNSSDDDHYNKMFDKLCKIDNSSIPSRAVDVESVAFEEKDPGLINISAALMTVINGENAATGETLDDYGGLIQAILLCLKQVSPINRLSVASNIILCGGGAGVPILRELLQNEIRRRIEVADSILTASLGSQDHLDCLISCSNINSNTAINNKNNRLRPEGNCKLFQAIQEPLKQTNFDQKLLAWIGGSVFASVKTNDKMFLSLSDLQGKQSSSGSSGRASGKEGDITVPDWLSGSSSARVSDEGGLSQANRGGAHSNVVYFSPVAYKIIGGGGHQDAGNNSGGGYLGHKSANYSLENINSISSNININSTSNIIRKSDDNSIGISSLSNKTPEGNMTTSLNIKALLQSLPSYRPNNQEPSNTFPSSNIHSSLSNATLVAGTDSNNSQFGSLNLSTSIRASNNNNSSSIGVSSSNISKIAGSDSASAPIATNISSSDKINSIIQSIEEAKRKKQPSHNQ